jgi:hypothetical protein
MRWTLLALALVACDREPLPLPTAAAVAPATDDATERAPLYQLLYAATVGPAPTADLQRVRLLLWLRHMEMSPDQLSLLDELRAQAADRVARLEAAEAALLARTTEEEAAIYAELWAAIADGQGAGDPRLEAQADALVALGLDGTRQQELLALRMEGIRSMLDAQRPFLRTLTPLQEARLNDALFLLRHRLDPVGHPGDFRALVGTIYDPGQFAVLTRGATDASMKPLDIGGLWADDGSGLQGHPLHEAKREVLLFLALLEPGFDQAIGAARVLSEQQQGPAGAQP